MKTEDQITRAHDLIDIVLNEGICKIPNDRILRDLIGTKLILCWVLEHKDGQDLEENLVNLEAELFSKGIILKDSRAVNSVEDGIENE